MRIKTKLVNTIGAIEHVVEKVIEVPVELRRGVDVHDFEKGLSQAMSAYKTTYWNKNFVPNVYILRLRPKIYRRYYPITEKLRAHLISFVSRSIFEREYSTVGTIDVEIKEGSPEQESEIEVRCQIIRDTETDDKNAPVENSSSD